MQELKGENISMGFKIAATFIETTYENDRNDPHKKNGYLMCTVGGRRGACNLKFDAADAELVEAVSQLKMGDEIFASVVLSAFRDAVYYGLTGVQFLTVPDRFKAAKYSAPATASASAK